MHQSMPGNPKFRIANIFAKIMYLCHNIYTFTPIPMHTPGHHVAQHPHLMHYAPETANQQRVQDRVRYSLSAEQHHEAARIQQLLSQKH